MLLFAVALMLMLIFTHTHINACTAYTKNYKIIYGNLSKRIVRVVVSGKSLLHACSLNELHNYFFGATLWFAIRLHTLYNRVDVTLVVVLDALLHIDTVTLVQFTTAAPTTSKQTTLTRIGGQTHIHMHM